MTTEKFISRLIGLTGIKVKNFDLRSKQKRLDLFIKPLKNGCRCPKCGRRGTIVNKADRGRDFRYWKDIVVCGYQIYFWYAPKEIICSTHGRIQEEIPWSESNSRVTYRLEYRILAYSKIMTQKAASELLKMANSTLSDLLHRAIQRIRKEHKIRGVHTIGVDEISYQKGRKFVTIVYDLIRGCVLWVGKGKGRATIDKFFNDHLSKFQKNNIKWASCDMSDAYINGIKAHCPNVKLVLDRFHIVKALNEALDDVRKEEWRKLSGKNKKAMKGLRWLLYRHSTTRSKEETQRLKELKKSNNRIYRAWILKDEFEKFWEYLYTGSSKKFVTAWITRVMRSKIDSMKRFARTIRKNFDSIVTFTEGQISNATAEGINRILKIIKNRASGFRNVNSFIDMIFLVKGDLDILAQIPNEFRKMEFV